MFCPCTQTCQQKISYDFPQAHLREKSPTCHIILASPKYKPKRIHTKKSLSSRLSFPLIRPGLSLRMRRNFCEIEKLKSSSNWFGLRQREQVTIWGKRNYASLFRVVVVSEGDDGGGDDSGCGDEHRRGGSLSLVHSILRRYH